MHTVAPLTPPRGDATAELPAAQAPRRRGTIDHGEEASARRLWPLAAAAAVLTVLGLGALLVRAGNPTPTTELVAGQAEQVDVEPLDGPDGEGEPVEADPAIEDSDETDPDEPEPSGDASTAVDTAESTDSPDGSPAGVATPLMTPSFDSAPGAGGGAPYLPLDGGVPPGSTFLGTWDERAVSFYAVTNPEMECTDLNYSEIRYVNGSRITQLVRDPQLHFSGEISHLTIRTEQNLAAWIVSCGAQLELYIATLDDTGEVLASDLVWFGEGSIASALVLWDQDEVSFNAISPEGDPFAVDYDLTSGLLARNGGPSRVLLEAGAPARRELTPLAASADAGLSYWAGGAPEGEAGACGGPLGNGEGVADTLWLRQGEGQWLPAVADGPLLGAITAVALEAEFSQIAFADRCPGQLDRELGRVFIGTQRADGLISNLREVDLTPFVPGYAEQLHWVDSQTLRIETNNSDYGFGTKRFDFRLDDGRSNGVIVQLD